jgi:hypothetical protein
MSISQRFIVPYFLLSLMLTSLIGCTTSQQTPIQFEVSVDVPCELYPGQTIPLSVRGQIPSNAEIKWGTIDGVISNESTLSTTYTAPLTEGRDVITVRIISQGKVTIETLSCSIKAGTTPVAVITDPTPVVVDEDEMPVIEANDQTTPTAEIEPTTEADIDPTIAITEVMANPCNTEVTGVIDQYVELYNYGNNPVDISEWWLVSATVSHTDHHDQLVKIVSWNTRNPFIDLGSHLIQDQTVLNPKQYALVLHPLYGSAGSGSMTYRLPPDTVILTAAEGLSNIAGKFFSTTRPNIVALYIGSQDQINEVIS